MAPLQGLASAAAVAAIDNRSKSKQHTRPADFRRLDPIVLFVPAIARQPRFLATYEYFSDPSRSC